MTTPERPPSRWKLSELGEAAYLAHHRYLAHRARRSTSRGFSVGHVLEPTEWKDLTARDRSAWMATAREVVNLVLQDEEGAAIDDVPRVGGGSQRSFHGGEPRMLLHERSPHSKDKSTSQESTSYAKDDR